MCHQYDLIVGSDKAIKQVRVTRTDQNQEKTDVPKILENRQIKYFFVFSDKTTPF